MNNIILYIWALTLLTISTLGFMGFMWIILKITDWISLNWMAHKYAKDFPHNIKKINDEIGWRLK